jgi:CRISPR-associated protein Csd1
LLKSEKNRQYIGGDTLVYWAEGEGETEAEAFSCFSNPTEDDSEKLSAIMGRISQGQPVDLDGCDFQKPFYLLCLSPNAARISVRFFHVGTFGKIIAKIAEHYGNLELYSAQKETFKYLPPWILLSETTVKGSASDAAPLLGGQLMRSLLLGERYPITLFNAILTRIRSGSEINRAKSAVIKAVLIRNYKESEVSIMALNPESTNAAYVLGRLFSVLERLQAQANKSANIRERYFASACANPCSVFPTLLKLSTHHSAKLDNAVFYEKLKTDLLGRLESENPFPAAFSLDNQGRFILGYYHQTQELFTSKKEKETTENEQSNH